MFDNFDFPSIYLSFLSSSSMAPFRNFLARRSGVPNGAQTENSDENARPSDSHRSTPLSIKRIHCGFLRSKVIKLTPMRYSRRRQRFLSSGISLPSQSHQFDFYGPGN